MPLRAIVPTLPKRPSRLHWFHLPTEIRHRIYKLLDVPTQCKENEYHEINLYHWDAPALLQANSALRQDVLQFIGYFTPAMISTHTLLIDMRLWWVTDGELDLPSCIGRSAAAFLTFHGSMPTECNLIHCRFPGGTQVSVQAVVNGFDSKPRMYTKVSDRCWMTSDQQMPLATWLNSGNLLACVCELRETRLWTDIEKSVKSSIEARGGSGISCVEIRVVAKLVHRYRKALEDQRPPAAPKRSRKKKEAAAATTPDSATDESRPNLVLPEPPSDPTLNGYQPIFRSGRQLQLEDHV